MKRKTQKREAAPAIETVQVSSIAQLEEVCRQTVTARFAYRGKQWEMAGQALTPAQSDRVNLLLEQAMPEMLPAETPGGEPRYDLRSAAYLERKQKFKAQARAMALFMGYPCLAEDPKLKGLTKVEEITAVVQGLFTDEIQNYLFEEVVGKNDLWRRVGLF